MVTLNPKTEIDPEKVLKKMTYTHPIMSKAAMDTQAFLPELNQGSKIALCGSYFGYGFHEDGLRSGLEAAKSLRQTLSIG